MIIIILLRTVVYNLIMELLDDCVSNFKVIQDYDYDLVLNHIDYTLHIRRTITHTCIA